jgi:predicted nuclease of predicted toxin-antitoxin system
VRFLVDECLSPALAAALCKGGHDAVHIVDLGQRGAPDTVVMQLARLQQRVLVSADTDFGELLARNHASEPSVVLFRGDEVDPAALAATLLGNLEQVEQVLVSGAIVVILDDRIRVRRLPIGADPEQP